jgi:hypothetical protein
VLGSPTLPIVEPAGVEYIHPRDQPRSFFFGVALLAIAIAAVAMWFIFFAPPAGCRQAGPHEFLCDHPFSGSNPPGQLQH